MSNLPGDIQCVPWLQNLIFWSSLEAEDCGSKPVHTLVYRIEVQAQINVQVGELLEINKHAVQNKHAWETSYKKSSNVQDLIDV